MLRCTCRYCKRRFRSNPQRICASCEELKPHYSHKLCYLCYRKLQCRWLEDVDKWIDTLEKPQCQNLMHKMGFCTKHWKRIEQEERARKNRDAESNPFIITDEMKKYRRRRGVTHLFEMRPRDFLLLTTDTDEHMKDIMDDAETLDKYNSFDNDCDIYLDILVNKTGKIGKVINHEGRHRSAAVLAAGENKLEVSIRFYADIKKLRKQVRLKILPEKIIHQFAKGFRGKKARTVIMGVNNVKVKEMSKRKKKPQRHNPETPELIEYKIQRAMTKALELEGWDVFSTSREQNLNLREEDLRTVAARFWLKETAWNWVHYADGDKYQVQKWTDERFRMPCYLALVEYHFDG